MSLPSDLKLLTQVKTYLLDIFKTLEMCRIYKPSRSGKKDGRRKRRKMEGGRKGRKEKKQKEGRRERTTEGFLRFMQLSCSFIKKLFVKPFIKIKNRAGGQEFCTVLYVMKSKQILFLAVSVYYCVCVCRTVNTITHWSGFWRTTRQSSTCASVSMRTTSARYQTFTSSGCFFLNIVSFTLNPVFVFFPLMNIRHQVCLYLTVVLHNTRTLRSVIPLSRGETESTEAFRNPCYIDTQNLHISTWLAVVFDDTVTLDCRV